MIVLLPSMIAKVVLLYAYLYDYVNRFGGIFRDQTADRSNTLSKLTTETRWSVISFSAFWLVEYYSVFVNYLYKSLPKLKSTTKIQLTSKTRNNIHPLMLYSSATIIQCLWIIFICRLYLTNTDIQLKTINNSAYKMFIFLKQTTI